MTRDIALRFNHLYGEDVLVVPEPLIGEEVATIPGLDGQKMSKSYNNMIFVCLPSRSVNQSCGFKPTLLEWKIPKILTSATCSLYRHFTTAEEQATLAERYRAGGMGYGSEQQLFEVVRKLGELEKLTLSCASSRDLEGILEKVVIKLDEWL